MVRIPNVIQCSFHQSQRAVLVKSHAKMWPVAISCDSNVWLMSADCETTSNWFDECLFEVKVSSTNVAGAINQERNVSGNRNMRYTFQNKRLGCRFFFLHRYKMLHTLQYTARAERKKNEQQNKWTMKGEVWNAELWNMSVISVKWNP